MKRFLALSLVACGFAFVWFALDQPLPAPEWKGKLAGLSYNPSGIFTEEQFDTPVSERRLHADFAHLSKITRRIRTYSVDRGLDQVPQVARQYGLKVTLGLWLSDDREMNAREIERGTAIIRKHDDIIDRVIVGNEVILRGELTPEEVAAYIEQVRKGIRNRDIQVGTADVWNNWLDHPVLAEASDFIGAHVLPYWEGIGSHDAVGHILYWHGVMRDAFPDKPIVIAEAGWPSEGRVKGNSAPSAAREAHFLRNFLAMARSEDLDYYIMEAYDQPWKEAQEGAVGAFWGIFDADRQPKFSFTAELSSFPQWPVYASAALLGTFLLGFGIMLVLPPMRLPGDLMMSAAVGLAVTGVLFVLDATAWIYLDWETLLTLFVLGPAVLFTCLLLVTETVEWALSLWRGRRRAVPGGQLATFPKVSIHVPTYNEPPHMVMQTLDALARLDYPNFEVIILDNNTRDESVWRPVAAHCERLGPAFRFYHFDDVAGFKAGALNLARGLTAPDAEFVAVIDSDYQVAPSWLRRAIPVFADAAVALVQAPQDYRDGGENAFKRMCYEEYRGFFHIGMVERDEHNAIIQHGTMCVVRRAALDAVDGWAQWCITEDTELGLRLFERGWTAVYLPESMGQGLMPDTYAAYKDQRYRWVYGAMQILKRHSAALFAGAGNLSRGQRYHFVAGWLPWFADALGLVFSVLSLVWALLVILSPRQFDVPLAAFSMVVITLFAVKTLKTLVLHRFRIGAQGLAVGGAALAGLSLAFVVGKAVIFGLATSSLPFVRTPKCETGARWTASLGMVRVECALLVLTVAALIGLGIVTEYDDPAEILAAIALSVMAVPYAAAVAVALGSTRGTRPAPGYVPELLGPAEVPSPSRKDLDLAA
jgi:exo-beta-1,3-glucanase (GH17 family)/cellulose synthase/poly-beta-1,6-N-acetylglucosamine synthase-like glycosyltransferase